MDLRGNWLCWTIGHAPVVHGADKRELVRATHHLRSKNHSTMDNGKNQFSSLSIERHPGVPL